MQKFSRKLRKCQTEAEAKLWYFLRNRYFDGLKFRRQHPIGKYIVDFYCPEKKVILELDGGHHSTQKDLDNQRTSYLNSKGYHVYRFWDHDVLTRSEFVLESIRLILENDPHPGPLPKRERGSLLPT